MQISALSNGVVIRGLINNYWVKNQQKFGRTIQRQKQATQSSSNNSPINKQKSHHQSPTREMGQSNKTPISNKMTPLIKKTEVNPSVRSIVLMKRRNNSLSQESHFLEGQQSQGFIDNGRKSKYQEKFKQLNLHKNHSSSIQLEDKKRDSQIHLNKTQQQFISLQPLKLGLEKDISQSKINQNLLKIGTVIKQQANKDIMKLQSIKNSSIISQKVHQNKKLAQKPHFQKKKVEEQDNRNDNVKIEIVSDISPRISTSMSNVPNLENRTQSVQFKLPKPYPKVKNQDLSQDNSNINSFYRDHFSYLNAKQAHKRTRSTSQQSFYQHNKCESFEQHKLNKTISKLLKNEIKVEDFLSAKESFSQFRKYQNVSPENIKHSLLSPLSSYRKKQGLDIPEEQKYRFSQFIQLCKEQIEKGHYELERKFLNQSQDSQQESEQKALQKILQRHKFNQTQKDSIDLEKKTQEISENFDKDSCKQYLSQVDNKTVKLKKQSTMKHNSDLIENIINTLNDISKINQNINENIDKGQHEKSFKDNIQDLTNFTNKFESQAKKNYKMRQITVQRINNSKVKIEDLKNSFKSEKLNIIQLGFDELVDQVNQWSKERANILKDLWKQYETQLFYEVSMFLNDQKDFNQDLIKILHRSLTLLEEKQKTLLHIFEDFLVAKNSHQDLQKIFTKCVNQFHNEEEKNAELREKISDLEYLVELWLPNLNAYAQVPDIKMRMEALPGLNKMWGMSSNQVGDLALRDQMLDKLSKEQKWIKSDIERIIQNAFIITNDKIECERINRELVLANKKLMKKKVQVKELRIDLDKCKRNLSELVQDLEQEKLKTLDYQQLKTKLIKQEKQTQEKIVQCDLLNTSANIINQINAKLKKDIVSKLSQSYSLNNLYSAKAKNPGSPQRIMMLDQIISKFNLTSSNFNSTEKDEKNSLKKKNSLTNIGNKSPGKGPQMQKIEELVQLPIPTLYKEKAQQLLQIISSMMTKLVIQPFRHVKELFVEELFAIHPNVQKAGELAEEYMKTIFQVHQKDSRIRLFKSLIGLGEEKPFTQPIAQNFVNWMQDTQLPFDDIFTGEIQYMKVDLEHAIGMLKQRIQLDEKQHITKKILDQAINNIINKASIMLNGKEIQLEEIEKINYQRILRAIINKEKRKNPDEMFQKLLKQHNYKVTIDDFLRYINQELLINENNYVSNFADFYFENLDTSNRGYISSYELTNISEMDIDIKVTLLNFIKESLNSIIQLDNLINGELERVYHKFDEITGSGGKGLHIQGLKDCFTYLIQSLTEAKQKEAQIKVKDIIDTLEKRKNQKPALMNLDDFVSVCKEQMLFQNLESLQQYNNQKLLKLKQLKNRQATQNLQPGIPLSKPTDKVLKRVSHAMSGDNFIIFDANKSSHGQTSLLSSSRDNKKITRNSSQKRKNSTHWKNRQVSSFKMDEGESIPTFQEDIHTQKDDISEIDEDLDQTTKSLKVDQQSPQLRIDQKDKLKDLEEKKEILNSLVSFKVQKDSARREDSSPRSTQRNQVKINVDFLNEQNSIGRNIPTSSTNNDKEETLQLTTENIIKPKVLIENKTGVVLPPPQKSQPKEMPKEIVDVINKNKKRFKQLFIQKIAVPSPRMGPSPRITSFGNTMNHMPVLMSPQFPKNGLPLQLQQDLTFQLQLEKVFQKDLSITGNKI